jgi:hypothetical protein
MTGVCQKGLMRINGLWEITYGVGILANSRPTVRLWGRVAGDAFDLATAGTNFAGSGGDRRRAAPAGRSHQPRHAADNFESGRLCKGLPAPTDD